MDREEVSNVITYAAIQTMIENAVLGISGFESVDRSKLTPYVFNSIARRASQLTEQNQ